MEGDNLKPEYTSKFPLGRIPGFEGADGLKLIEARSIARYGECLLAASFT